MRGLERRNPDELDSQQAVREFVETVMPFELEHRKYKDAQIFKLMTEPDRTEDVNQLLPCLEECHTSSVVHLIDVPMDYSENDRISNHGTKELSSKIQTSQNNRNTSNRNLKWK